MLLWSVTETFLSTVLEMSPQHLRESVCQQSWSPLNTSENPSVNSLGDVPSTPQKIRLSTVLEMFPQHLRKSVCQQSWRCSLNTSENPSVNSLGDIPLENPSVNSLGAPSTPQRIHLSTVLERSLQGIRPINSFGGVPSTHSSGAV